MKTLIAFLLSIISAHAATYYVDPVWTGSQTGAAATPWQTLNWTTINSALGTGPVTVYFSARSATSASDPAYSGGIDLNNKAASANLLTLDGKSYYNTSTTTPSWTANTGSTMCKITYVDSQNSGHVKRSNVTIHGFRITCSLADSKIVTICGDNFTLEYCDCSHTSAAANGPGVLLVPTADGAHEGSSSYAPACTNIVIRYNKIHDTEGEALYLGGGGTNPGQAGSGYPSHKYITVHGNEIYSAGTRGGQGDAIDAKGGLDFLTVTGNTIYNLQGGSGNPVRAYVQQGKYNPTAGEYTTIAGNLIYNCPNIEDGALAIVNSWGTPANMRVYNNVIYNITRSGARPVGIKQYASSNQSIIANNTVYACSGYALESAGNVYLRNNLFISNNGNGNNVNMSGTISSDYNARNNTWGYSGEGANSVQIAGSLSTVVVNAAAGNFRLVAGSPAIGRGLDLAYYTTDFAGVTRTLPWDIGAYAYGGTPTQPAAPTNLRIIP